jgi:hypothetical protein
VEYIENKYNLELNKPLEEKGYSINSTLNDIKDNPMAKRMYKKLLSLSDPDKATTPMDKHNAMVALEENPLRFYTMFNPSPIDRYKLESFVEKLNKNEIKAIKYKFKSKLLKRDRKDKLKEKIKELD